MVVRAPVRVILVTDGDGVAREAVETAARNLGLRCISASAGNPTPLDGEQLVGLVRQAAHDPVVVMVDDRGDPGPGPGEQALAYLAAHPDVRVLGAVAVASDTPGRGVPVDCSITADGAVVQGPVNKAGQPAGGTFLRGDTVGVLRRLRVPVVVGMGDPGKMAGADAAARGAYLTTRAIGVVLRHGGTGP